MAKFYSIKVLEIIQLTQESVEIIFDIPENLTEFFSYKSGQYITIEAEIKGESVRRAYSICSAMCEKKLSIGVKKVENGKMSTWLNEKVNVGDSLNLMPPNGNFLLNSRKNNNYFVGLCAGSGITPVLSMIKDSLHSQENSFFTLFYGNRNPETEMFKNDIELLVKKYSKRFKLISFYSDTKIDGKMHGNIDVENLNKLFEKEKELINSDGFFICGPGDMIDNLSDCLKKMSISEDKIIFERFSSSIENKEADLIAQSMSCNYTFIIDDDEYECSEDSSDETVLDIALKNDIDAPYSCKGAVCSTCKAKVISGKVEMTKNFSLSESEVEDGYILTCVSHHKSEDVTIDFDVF